MSSNLRSFRKSGTDGLVREECDQCRMFFRFSDGKGKDREILLSFRPKGEKSLFLDGEKLSKLGDFLGEFPSVALSSRDFRLVREGPSERRKWLDLLLSTASTEYFQSLQLYHRALRERNALLKKGGGDRELDAFEQALIPSGLRIQKMRVDALPKISVLLSESYAALSSKKRKPTLPTSPTSCSKASRSGPSDWWRNELKIGSWAIRVEVLIVTTLLFSAMARMPEPLPPKVSSVAWCWLCGLRNFSLSGKSAIKLRLFLPTASLVSLTTSARQTSSNCSPRGSSLCHGDFVPIPWRRGQMGNFPGFFRHLFEKLAFQSVQVLSFPSSCKFLSH